MSEMYLRPGTDRDRLCGTGESSRARSDGFNKPFRRRQGQRRTYLPRSFDHAARWISLV